MIKTAGVVYFPGTGGNFVRCCLSLSPETVPYYWKNLSTLSDQELVDLRSMTAEQRQEILKFFDLKDFNFFNKVEWLVEVDLAFLRH